MVTHRLSGRAGAGSFRGVPCALLITLAAGSAACDKVPLLAPRGSTVTLSAAAAILPVNGSTDITATVLEAPGTPVHNGTLVRFTTTLGTLDPPEARTHNGQASVRLHVGGLSGVAEVRAFSGDASSPAGTDALLILVGGAAAGAVQVTVSPTELPSGGGNVLVTAIVTDVSGNPLPGAPVSFSTDAGTLAQNPVLTDTNGLARTTLNTVRTANVTATIAGKTSSAQVVVAEPPERPGTISVTITAPATITEDQPASFTFTVTREATAPRLVNVTVNWGDGITSSLGPVTSQTVTHVYTSPGTFTVTATAFDESGGQTPSSTQVFVQQAAPPTIGAITVSTGGCGANGCNPGEPVQFSVTATAPTGQFIDRYVWTFGDGGRIDTNSNTVSHAYETPGTFTVVVTAFTNTGSSVSAQTQVQILAPPDTP